MEKGLGFRAKGGGIESSNARVVLHRSDLSSLGLDGPGFSTLASPKEMRVRIGASDTLVSPGDALVPDSLMKGMGLVEGDTVWISLPARPRSVDLVKKTMEGRELSATEMGTIIEDIMSARLSKVEVSSWLTSLHINGLTDAEVYDLTMAMAASGETVDFGGGAVFDFHSVGGVPGNKITPIVVSIAAAAGLMIPKTSSRAISSACGTADFVEVFADVEMDSNRIRDITRRTGGVFAWGGAMNLTPVNGIIIETQYPLGIDPRSIMTASIMSKKLAMGADHMVMDIPMGPGTKVTDMEEALVFARGFTELGGRLGIEVRCAVTDGRQPLGFSIGPALEARECIQALECMKGLYDVWEKAAGLAGMLLDMAGMKDGETRAKDLLRSGKALSKFREIVGAQGGDPDITSEDIVPGAHMEEIYSSRTGYVNSIDNKALVAIARAAGAPRDKGGGIVLNRKLDHRVEAGDVLFRIYADHPEKLRRAKGLAMKIHPLKVGGLLLEKTSQSGTRTGLSLNGQL